MFTRNGEWASAADCDATVDMRSPAWKLAAAGRRHTSVIRCMFVNVVGIAILMK